MMGEIEQTGDTAKQAPQLLSVEAARARMLADVAPPAGAESVALDAAGGRVLACDLAAALAMPRWANSAMDGYALRLADITDAGLTVSQCIAAGSAPAPLAPGTAARIYTGAPIPAGADTVVMQEHCHFDGQRLHVEKCPEMAANIRPAAEDFSHGDTLLGAGEHLRPQHIALAAAAGAESLAVYPRLRLALLITGDELVPPGKPLGDGQIHESNGHMLAALARELGAEVVLNEHVPDEPAATQAALERAAQAADLVVTSGGASVGDHDHVRAAATSVGEVTFFGIAVKPGKPLAFGRIANTLLLVLPGNPVSVFVTFLLFGAPLVRQMQGRRVAMPAAQWVPAGFEQTRTRSRADYIRVRLDEGRAVPCGAQGSGLLTPTAAADGLACIPPDARVAPGEPLAYYPMASLLD